MVNNLEMSAFGYENQVGLRQQGKQTGLHCKQSKGERKQDVVLYLPEVLVRARRLEDGPPLQGGLYGNRFCSVCMYRER